MNDDQNKVLMCAKYNDEISFFTNFDEPENHCLSIKYELNL